MENPKFELFMGFLGNGITLCNKAVEEYGDYKQIGHIGEDGKLRLYVNQNYIPTEAMDTIQKMAHEQRQKYLSWWDKLSIDEK